MTIIFLLNGLLYVLVYVKFGLTLSSILYCLIISLLITISIIDLRHKIIPDSLTMSVLVLGIIHLIITKELFNSIIGALIGLGLFHLIALITNVMGGGDIKLMAVLGLMFGIKGILFISLFSFVIGAVISIILVILKIKSMKDEVPFGPFISIAALIYIFFGNEIIYWYLSFAMNY